MTTGKGRRARQRGVIYARISQDRSGAGLGVKRQVDDCRALAERLDVEVVGEPLVDNDTSAYRRRRPRTHWQQVERLVRDGDVDVVLGWHLDRLTRDPLDLEALCDLVEERGLRIATVTAGDLDLGTPSGRMVARMLAAAARQEVEHKAERQARKHAELAEAGKRSGGGRLALGYRSETFTRKDESTGRRLTDEVEPVEAEALRDAAAYILAGGTLAEATRRVAAAIGRPVRTAGLKGALCGPRIAGYRQHIPAADRRRYEHAHAEYTAAHRAWAERRKRRPQADPGPEPQPPERPTPRLYPARWPAILDPETWSRVRAVLLDPARGQQRPARVSLLGGGLLRCGVCRRPLGAGGESYRCSAKGGGCGTVAISRPGVERAVAGAVRRLVEDSGGVDEVLARVLAAGDEARGVDGAEVDRLRRKRDEVLALWREGVVTGDELRAERARIDELLDAQATAQAERERRRAVLDRAGTALRAWDDATTTERRAAVAAVLDTVYVKPAAHGKRNGNRLDPARLDPRWVA